MNLKDVVATSLVVTLDYTKMADLGLEASDIGNLKMWVQRHVAGLQSVDGPFLDGTLRFVYRIPPPTSQGSQVTILRCRNAVIQAATRVINDREQQKRYQAAIKARS